MALIELLNDETIDKIAAGEVVERPASIVKELVENSIDANATSITVEIKEGGVSFIRVTDNGDGISKEQVKKAFCRHATSKLKDVSDLDTLLSLGFRGEALSSIASISMVEIMTKTKDELIGTRYVIEGGISKEFCEIGIPTGTTIIVRNVFFNTPVRRKFLKSTATEGGYICDICEHLAMSVPNVSFKFINGGKLRFNTSGSGDLKEVIYRIYGKDVAKELIPISRESKEITVKGYLGKPILNRASRNFEKFFINGRYVRSATISNAAEAGYKEYLMQHKFPFFVFDIKINTTSLDVNVHPTKMEVRFNNEGLVYDFIQSAVFDTLRTNEMIPLALLTSQENDKLLDTKQRGPEPFESKRIGHKANADSDNSKIYNSHNDCLPKSEESNEIVQNEQADENESKIKQYDNDSDEINVSLANRIYGNVINEQTSYDASFVRSNVIKAKDICIENPVQMNLFEEKILSKEAFEEYNIVGQIFDTYWLITYKNQLLILDQHAAHEKIKYEALIKQLKERDVDKQLLTPPIVITLSLSLKNVLDMYRDYFEQLGYEFEDFAGDDIVIRAVPYDLYGLDERRVFLDILDELSVIGKSKNVPDVFCEHIASMACKAAVKGNSPMTFDEAKELLSQLLTLENPYNCPHGRPTIVTMTKYELEKKFKRIV